MLLPDALYNLISMEIYTMNLITKLDAWKQITEVGGMNYNFNQDINDFTQRFLRIIGKYE